MIMKQAQHLTSEGLRSIINIKASMNKGITPALKEAFPDYITAPRPSIHIQKLLPIQPY
jgi:hypothetical protein